MKSEFLNLRINKIAERQYEDFVRHVHENGAVKTDRTGTGTKSVFGYQMRFNLALGLPVVTTKKTYMKAVITELLWFLRGDTNLAYLHEHGCHIWDEWADENGNLGKIYGHQWRSWTSPNGMPGGIDQISQAIGRLKHTPDSRQIIVSAWNVGELSEMNLMPCHAMFQFYTAPLSFNERLHASQRVKDAFVKSGDDDMFTPAEWDQGNDGVIGKYLDDIGVARIGLSCQLYQRSADMFLGVPFNIASYSLLTCMFAAQLGYEPMDFIWTGGDCHLYSNHAEQVKTLLTRQPFAFPDLRLPVGKSIFDYTHDDFVISDYECHPSIPAPVAV